MSVRFRWSPFLRLLLGLVLIAILIRSIGWNSVRAAVEPIRSHPGEIAGALALTGLALLAGVVRWHLILHTMNLPAPFVNTFRGFFIGQFFNAFLFGACGGDLARAIHAAHHHSEKRTEAVTSVFLDRALGLVITLLFGCAMLLPHLGEFARDPEARLSVMLMAVFLAGTVVFLALFFTHNLFSRIPWLARLQHHGRIGPLLHRAYDAIFLFRQNVRHLLGPAVLSVVNLLLLAAATATLARALGLAIRLPDLLTVYPVITVLAAVPLTPGSLGVRETLYVQLLHPLGILPGPALMLSLLGYLAASAWSLFGGLLFLMRPRPV